MSDSKLFDILQLYYKITGEIKKSTDIRANGVTFQKIAYSTDGGFERYVNRAQKKIADKRILSKDLNKDKQQIQEIFRESFDLLLSRNKKYGDSWKVMSIQAIASLCEMKLNRIAQLGELETKTFDEIQDVFNYMSFAMLKLKEQNKIRED